MTRPTELLDDFTVHGKSFPSAEQTLISIGS